MNLARKESAASAVPFSVTHSGKGWRRCSRRASATRPAGWISHPRSLTGTADAADSFRAKFIHDHLAAIAASELPFERYYHWCFTDNWEWAEGEVPRFGLVDLDYATQLRTPRASARFYSDAIANGAVTEEAHERWVAPQSYRIG